MAGLLEQLVAQRKAKLDEAAGDYTATPQTVSSSPVEADPAAETQSLPENFAVIPKKKTVVRPGEDEGWAKLWSPYSKMWIPVKTYKHDLTGLTYWYDGSEDKYYPMPEDTNGENSR